MTDQRKSENRCDGVGHQWYKLKFYLTIEKQNISSLSLLVGTTVEVSTYTFKSLFVVIPVGVGISIGSYFWSLFYGVVLCGFLVWYLAEEKRAALIELCFCFFVFCQWLTLTNDSPITFKIYCKFKNFRENFIFLISVKRHKFAIRIWVGRQYVVVVFPDHTHLLFYVTTLVFVLRG